MYMNINIQENIVTLTVGKLYSNENCYHKQNICLLKWTFKEFCWMRLVRDGITQLVSCERGNNLIYNNLIIIYTRCLT